MAPFQIYFAAGKDHILDYSNGYNHVLFIISLFVLYSFRDWKKVLFVMAIFTVGYSTTMILNTLNLIAPNEDQIQFLIPATTLVTACANILRNEERAMRLRVQLNYVFALFFGLIHGLGFSEEWTASIGNDHAMAGPLFAFNLGAAFGQILVVLAAMVTTFLLVEILTINKRDWRLVISSAIAGIALLLMMERVYW